MDDLIPFSSLLLQDMVGTPEMRRVWSEQAMVRGWMEVERAITETQAEIGMVPRDAAETIAAHLTLEALPIDRIKEQTQQYGHLMVSFLKAFRRACGDAAEHLHVGPTTQDILDTALTLQIREAQQLIRDDALRLERTLCERAVAYRDTVMMGRTHQQHAVPLTLGLVLATWADELDAHLERADESRKRWHVGSLSGGVGAHNAFVELSDAATARALERAMCERLGLDAPRCDMHGRTDRFAEVVSILAGQCSMLGRIGLTIRSWERPEVMEAETAYGPDECYSSTMPNKRNPEGCERAEGLATLVRALALAMQDVQTADHRDSTRIPVLYTAVPLSHMMAARSLRSIESAVAGLIVHETRMRANLDHPNALGQAAGERLMIAFYRKTGRRDLAHTRLQRCSRISLEQGRPLADVVLEDEELAPHFSREELDRLTDLSTYTGTAAQQTDEIVARLRERRGGSW